MNEKPDPRTRLVAEVFNDDWVAGPTSAFARAAAAHARRRRAVRQTLRIGGAVAVVIVAILAFNRARVPQRPSSALPIAELATAEIAPTSKTFPAFEIISDEQLVAELRGRPLLILPQEPEARRFVLLSR